MTKFIYNFYLFYKFDLLRIMKMQINNILILTNDVFASNKKKTIKITKIIIKDCKYLIFI